jgi:hypothetical protein
MNSKGDSYPNYQTGSISPVFLSSCGGFLGRVVKIGVTHSINELQKRTRSGLADLLL